MNKIEVAAQKLCKLIQENGETDLLVIVDSQKATIAYTSEDVLAQAMECVLCGKPANLYIETNQWICETCAQIQSELSND